MSYDHTGQTPMRKPDEPVDEATDSGSGTPHAEILDAIRDRKGWEDKQTLFYQMRHDGVRRKKKPWPGAADMHFPLADTLIEKIKPYYMQQVFAGETVAGFYAMKSENARFQTAAAQWFDYQIKQNSNFEEFLSVAIDGMCQGGRNPVRVRWDFAAEQLRFDAPAPDRVIVPAWTKNIAEADWVTLVQSWSVAAYKRAGVFDCEADLIKRISGSGRSDSGENQNEEDIRLKREGLTIARSDKEIVLWTVHTRTDAGWLVSTYSPTSPKDKVRADFMLPYNQGEFAKGAPPFAQLSFELKEDGYYSARGVCERVAAFESSLNKDWNTLKDYQTLTTQPLFYSEGAQPNVGNLQFVPGQVFNKKIEAVQFPRSPVDIMQSMDATRATAEQLVALPDFGMGANRSTGGAKTATEVQALTAVMGNNVELRARVFRRELGLILNLAWSLLIQYAKDKRDFFYQDQLGELPEEAAGDLYRIEPNGSGDNFNREFQVQKAYGRFQTFNGNPFINQQELTKVTLETDDPRLVRRLFQTPQIAAATQTEDQAQELSIMLMGFPAMVQPSDDHAAHLECGMQYIQAQIAKQVRFDPEAAALIAKHLLEHLQALREQDKPAAAPYKQAESFLQQMMQSGQQAAQMRQQQQQMAAQQAQPMPQPMQPGAPAQM
ncbi:MAG: hypothetical protein RL077_353 [Verrucomicrobiota bacterium]